MAGKKKGLVKSVIRVALPGQEESMMQDQDARVACSMAENGREKGCMVKER